MRSKDEFLRDLIGTENRPIVGWFSTYTPVEILHAVGIIPHRVAATRKSHDLASFYLSESNCPYVMSCLEAGLQGEYDFLDGILVADHCDVFYSTYVTWTQQVQTGFSHLFHVPRAATAHAERYFRKTIRTMTEKIGAHFGVRVTDDRLREAIALCNRTRRLLDRLFSLRREHPDLIGEVRTADIVRASMVGLNGAFNAELRAFLDEIEGQTPASDESKPRILLCGGFLELLDLFELIEDLGATVVCESLCNGVRYLEGTVREEGDPIEALSRHYLGAVPQCRMLDGNWKFEYLWKLVKTYRVDGLVYFSLKFCADVAMDFPPLMNRFEERNVPVLLLETDGFPESWGQTATRIQAFLEMVEHKPLDQAWRTGVLG